MRPALALRPKKLSDRALSLEEFLTNFSACLQLLIDDPSLEKSFKKEMVRFLPAEQGHLAVQEGLWSFTVYLLGDLQKRLVNLVK